MKRKITAMLLVLTMILCTIPTLTFAAGKTYDWVVYAYLCGANLESDDGATTLDLIEMLRADIPDNVRIIAMTGGAAAWDPKGVGAAYNEEVGIDAYIQPSVEYNQLFEIDNDKMTLIKTYDTYMNMGDPKTAEIFINDAVKYAPAKHIQLDFWNHGGALNGAEYDELMGNDNLSPMELVQVLEAAKKANGGEKIDIVSFDACLMSTFEIAYILSPYADYMVASEEVEPGEGWYYDYLSIFSKNKNVTAVDLGKEMIDKYAYSFDENGDWTQSSDCTLALTDLSKMEGLAEAFDALANDMLTATQDRETLVQIARIGESTQTMKDGYGMIDLYDFAYRLRDIDALRDSANKVIAALGTPPGSDAADYSGFVSEDNYVGNVLGSDPAVVYRGAGSKFDNCVGLTIFYPLSTYDISSANAVDFIRTYTDFGLSSAYGMYIMNVTVLADSLPIFNGQFVTEYDEAAGTYNLSVDPAEELFGVKSVSYITTFTELGENDRMISYILGTETVTNGYDTNKFTVTPYETWYSVNGKPVTVMISDYSDYTEDYGMAIVNATIPAAVIDEENGEEAMSYLVAQELIITDSDKFGEDISDGAEGRMYIKGIVTMPNGGMAPRVFYPEDGMKIKPALTLFDMETYTSSGYKVYDDTLEFAMDDDGDCYLTFGKTDLIGNGTTDYMSFFKAIDIQNHAHLSDPFEYAVINDFDEFNIDVIYPGAYSGNPIEPKVRLLYHGDEYLVEGVDYTVSYSNNVEIGTAYVTVTSLIDEMPGELTGSFTICPYADLAEECVKLLPEHDIIYGCTENYEYAEHIRTLEFAKYYYETGLPLSDESLAMLSSQYLNYVTYIDSSLSNNGVEAMCVFSSYGYISPYFPSLTLVARGGVPVNHTAYAAYANAAAEPGIPCIGNYNIGLYNKNDNNDLEIVNYTMIPGWNVALKITLPQYINTDTLKIYSYTDESDVPVPVEYQIVERGGEKYAIVHTSDFGYLALFAE